MYLAQRYFIYLKGNPNDMDVWQQEGVPDLLWNNQNDV